jgi:3-methyladenine DNA glycosylase AlkC
MIHHLLSHSDTADWLKVNPEPVIELIREWQQSRNKHTLWILKHATRKLDPELLL